MPGISANQPFFMLIRASKAVFPGATTMASAGKLQPKGGKGSVAASPAASPASSMEAGTGRGNTSAAKSSQLSETATEELLEELAMEEDAIAYDEPYLEEGGPLLSGCQLLLQASFPSLISCALLCHSDWQALAIMHASLKDFQVDASSACARR